jgi:hypothetical protein
MRKLFGFEKAVYRKENLGQTFLTGIGRGALAAALRTALERHQASAAGKGTF